MGFIRIQEEKMAMRFLIWQYEKLNAAPPSDKVLREHAKKLVDEAHKVARKRGKNVLSIMKELADDLKKKDK